MLESSNDINYRTWECRSSETVVEITEVRYRSSWAFLSNGEIMEFDQPKESIVPGKEVCFGGERVRNSTELAWWMLPLKMFE